MFIAVIAFVLMQPPSAAPPVVGQPTEGYYGAEGEHVGVEMSIDPKEVEVEGPLTLTLKITGADNPQSIKRPDLTKIRDFAERFHIDDLPETSAGSVRIFEYRLRPKNDLVDAVPPLLFHYYNPKLKQYQTTSPAKVLLDVRPHSAPRGGGVPMQEPEFLFKVVDQSDIARLPASDAMQFGWLMAALLIPLVVFEFWYLMWRRMRPSAAKMAQIRRTRAVRTALDALKGLGGVEQPALADRSAEIVRTYVEHRFGLPAHTATPEEITAEFERLGMPPGRIERTKAFFRLCDAARFGPPEKQSDSVASAAEQLVLTLENAV